MTDLYAHQMIRDLRAMSVMEADRILCETHSDILHRIAAVLGVRLPKVGGDKPVILCGALFRS